MQKRAGGRDEKGVFQNWEEKWTKKRRAADRRSWYLAKQFEGYGPPGMRAGRKRPQQWGVNDRPTRTGGVAFLSGHADGQPT